MRWPWKGGEHAQRCQQTRARRVLRAHCPARHGAGLPSAPVPVGGRCTRRQYPMAVHYAEGAAPPPLRDDPCARQTDLCGGTRRGPAGCSCGGLGSRMDADAWRGMYGPPRLCWGIYRHPLRAPLPVVSAGDQTRPKILFSYFCQSLVRNTTGQSVVQKFGTRKTTSRSTELYDRYPRQYRSGPGSGQVAIWGAVT